MSCLYAVAVYDMAIDGQQLNNSSNAAGKKLSVGLGAYEACALARPEGVQFLAERH